MSIRIVLVDDHQIFVTALCALLAKEPGFEVVGSTSEATGLIQYVDETQPDVVIMDLGMPGVAGLDAIASLGTQRPDIKIVVLSALSDRRYVAEALTLGARGYVVKSSAADELPRAIRAVMADQTYLCPLVAGALVETLRTRHQITTARASALGQRERTVLRLIAEGRTSGQIAESLHIASSTVDVHRRNIMRKLGLHSVADLTRYAIREGLVDS